MLRKLVALQIEDEILDAIPQPRDWRGPRD